MAEDEPQGQKISSEDIAAVSEKLAKLASDLPEAEKAVLGLVLARAQAAPEDLDLAKVDRERQAAVAQDPGGRKAVLETPFAGQLARAAGLFASPQVTVVVGWQFRFGLNDGPGDVVLPAGRVGEGPA